MSIEISRSGKYRTVLPGRDRLTIWELKVKYRPHSNL
jgi:hypothetical protein